MEKSGVLGQILALKGLDSKELIAEYSKVFEGEKPSSTNPRHLRRKIAYKLQEMAYGRLSDKAQIRINDFIKMYDPINNKQLRQRKDANTQGKTKIRDSRLPIPGSIITKIYKGRTIKIKVFEKEFECEGKHYKTLSQIASEITGAHWNGYLFFNL